MILGLPWTSWLLLLVAIGVGLTIEVIFYRAQRTRPPRPDPRETTEPT